MMTNIYLFTSDRLGFRNWQESDVVPFAAMNSDSKVMEHFPATLTDDETRELIKRQQGHFQEYGYTYFAVDLLQTGEFIGFIGLNYKTYEAPFNPAVDIGWRLKPAAWGKGYATEGAKRCLKYAFETLSIKKIVAVCTVSNTPSRKVMEKIGMKRKGIFKHPALKAHPEIEECLWFTIRRT